MTEIMHARDGSFRAIWLVDILCDISVLKELGRGRMPLRAGSGNAMRRARFVCRSLIMWRASCQQYARANRFFKRTPLTGGAQILESCQSIWSKRTESPGHFEAKHGMNDTA